MRRVLGTLALTACAVLGTGVASAQAPCDTYSGVCVEGTKTVKPSVRPSRSGLPFTGAEVTGLVAAGAGAVAGGTALVVAGRRRRRTVPTPA
ncbi:MAG TPA: LPXTG cell wall anchor domain-containing protein [Mycobacteriales bacterium]|jgi:LPXTG-motif cell wall-anchored protein|nr:LPXTG cell wall anchor domain-containing protein [Mycobacteriales bacterium]